MSTSSKWPKGKASLDPNHTHFIFVDKAKSMELNNDEFKASLMGACKIDGVKSETDTGKRKYSRNTRIILIQHFIIHMFYFINFQN